MRITESIIFNTYLNDIRKHQETLFDLHKQLSTGKSVNTLSDDPVNVGRILGTRTILSSYEQYIRNIDSGLAYLSVAESALERVKDVLIRAKEVAVVQATGTADARSRLNAAFEVSQMFDELVSLGNQNFQGDYIFAGYKNGTAPFDSSGNYSGDTGEYAIQVEQNKTITVGINGGEVLKGTGGGIDVFQVMSDLITALNSDDTDGIKTAVGRLDTAFDQVATAVSDLGGRVQRLNATKEDLENSQIDLRVVLSGMEDADVTEVISEMSKRQVALEAAMTSASRVFDLSLFKV